MPLLPEALDLHQLEPASRPAAWSGFGRPRTTTVVFADSPPWTIAPALFAAGWRRAAAAQDAREGEVDAPERAERAGWSVAGGDPSASISSAALS